MSTQSKHHFRKVYKSDHLGVPDLEDLLEEGKNLIFNIKEVKQEYNVSVAGKKGNYNIAYFHEGIKPLVLNATNAKVLKSFSGGSAFVEDWKDIPVELYIDASVKMKNEVVGGVRIKQTKPVINKEKPAFTKDNFQKAANAKATIETIKKSYTIDIDTEFAYLEFIKNVGATE
ncbi:hypothetical protein [Sphingobacterium multivorum]|uniref:Uncharacterized protein n=1 Tax=Sphingobacterium multivorum TaxID=28454 RepID=A0A654D1A8_SPHMU|nr:hypothetical protein [Sphingobacterium multivorum]VXC99614.1 hypothetical protein SPHINGO8BC_51480 [Sphingobacterium multivorum]